MKSIIKNLSIKILIVLAAIILLMFFMCEFEINYKFWQIYSVFTLWFVYLFFESKFQLRQIKLAHKKNKEILDSVLAHDFRNPILAQINALELLISGKMGKIEDYQLEILKQTLYSSKLVEEMLYSLISISNLELNSYNFVLENCNIENLLKNLYSKFENIAKSKSINVNLFFSKYNNYFIKADEVLLERAIINLILNAIYRSNENADINIFVGNAGDNLRFCVQSEILKTCTSNKKLEKIFDKDVIKDEKFRQIGAGLGMNLSKDIIESFGGQVFAKVIKTSKSNDILEFGFYMKIENFELSEVSENEIDYNSAAATALYKLI